MDGKGFSGITPESEGPVLEREREEFLKRKRFGEVRLPETAGNSGQKDEPKKDKDTVGGVIPVGLDAILKQINIVLPKDLMEKWEQVRDEKGGNLAEYIIGLVRKDLEGK